MHSILTRRLYPRLPSFRRQGTSWLPVRTLWLTGQSSAPTLHDALTTCRTQMQHQANTPQSIFPKFWRCDCILLVVSADYPSPDLEQLPQWIRQCFDPRVFAGGVVDRVAMANGSWSSGVNILAHVTPSSNATPAADSDSLPFTLFQMDDTVMFRRHLKDVQVGRWQRPHRYRRLAEENRTMEWARFQTVSQADNAVELPTTLDHLQRTSRPPAFFLFADHEPYQIVQKLNQQFPESNKYGVLTTATPFLNGRPYTLFHNDGIQSNGLVGVAFDPRHIAFPGQIHHPQLAPLGTPLAIARCRGNVVLEFGKDNDPRTLASLLRTTTPVYQDKSARLYAGILRTDNPPDERAELGVYQIIGGDPVKGTIVLDTVQELQPGQYIQLYHTPPPPAHTAVTTSGSCSDIAVTLRAIDSESDSMDANQGRHSNSSTNPRCFGAATTKGFIYGQHALDCAVPESFITLDIHSDFS
ncbi:hypothetical protein IWQ62_003019 [Dispira parvispora]|uniref:FIST domain-containing protein n=1 Tax=Dispira parvispora TaxID=1520584 RepID=A0A9W8E233_9FUNG|nr:hypothetical protein IWQ62_003019 [Dispira parvispora]